VTSLDISQAAQLPMPQLPSPKGSPLISEPYSLPGGAPLGGGISAEGGGEPARSARAVCRYIWQVCDNSVRCEARHFVTPWFSRGTPAQKSLASGPHDAWKAARLLDGGGPDADGGGEAEADGGDGR
jgi:hypothetical protein